MNTRLLPDEITRYFGDQSVTDILVNNNTEVWIERRGNLERGVDLLPGQIETALEKILTPLGRRLDRLSPIVDARLPDGTRVCAVIHPIAVHGTCVAFRLFRKVAFSISDFVPPEHETHLTEVMHTVLESTENILITGATGSGKTSLLAAMMSIPHDIERFVVLEDTHELTVQHPHMVRLETRSATAEGRGQITMDDLLRTALRLRPDRLVVGEVRGIEALTLVQAMNTGHSKCLATLHANSAIDGLHRLDLLTMQAAPGWTLQDARHMVSSAIGFVIHMKRQRHGARVIAEVAHLNGDVDGSTTRVDYLHH